jgi:3-methylcrotonyl-CoA carboxylase alpha subunit
MALFNKILIANRGEIACRIIRTAQRLGIHTVAVFSEADTQALHVKVADEAYLIGPAASKDSYLNITKIITIAQKANVDAIHPGYGFLSESADFANACERANITFIGPSAQAIALMANKNVAKAKVAEHNIATLPSHFDEEQSPETLLKHAKKIGFPIVLKAVAGGGGKGLRRVDQEQDFLHSYSAVKREANAFFNDDQLLVEKYLTNARHIEVQVLADHFGTMHTLFTRDCSIQRRHQKIVEEAPAPNLDKDDQDKIAQAAITIAKAIQYTNAGTIEFLVEDNAFYFMEMNTRLQVEHPVTEMITGVDIVEWQCRIAAGERLFANAPVESGHAIELRLNAEDPENDFLPSAGQLRYFQIPEQTDVVRIDSGFHQDDFVTIYYDSLLAKIIVWGQTRTQALQHLQQQLQEIEIFGIKTNLPLLKEIINDHQFKHAKFNTHFLQLQKRDLRFENPHIIYAMAALFLAQSFQPNTASPWQLCDGWRLNFPPRFSFQFLALEGSVTIEKHHPIFRMNINGCYYDGSIINTVVLAQDIYLLECLIADEYHRVKIFKRHNKLDLILQHQTYSLEIVDNRTDILQQDQEAQLIAPMPGTLVAVMVNSGQQVAKGDKLLVIEAMKMEHTLYAPRDGKIKLCHFKIGDLVSEGAELLEFED